MSSTRRYKPLSVCTLSPLPMASKDEGNVFPAPPLLRPLSIRRPFPTRNDNDLALEPSILNISRRNSQRSSSTHDLVRQADIEYVFEYLECLRQDLDAEKQKREADVLALRNQSQSMYESFTATSRRQHERAAAFKNLMQDQTRKVDKLQKRASALDASMKDVNLKMQEVAKEVQSDNLRKLMNVMPLGSHAGENIWSAQCIFVCNAARPNIFEVEGCEYLKLQHGRPAQKITFTGDSEQDFIQTVERNFAALLKDRSWMPLAAYRVSAHAQARVTLDRLTAKNREAATWTRQFLDEHCIVLDSKGRAHIYLALQNALLTLAEIQSLVAGDALAARKDQTLQHASSRSTNNLSGSRSSAATGSPYGVSNSFSPPQSSLTSSRTSIEADVAPLPTSNKRSTPPANHAVIRQPSNANHKPNVLSALSTAVTTSHTSQEAEADAQRQTPAPDTAVIDRIDHAINATNATNRPLLRVQASSSSVTALPKAKSSPATSPIASPILVLSPTPTLMKSRSTRKEPSLRQKLFKGSKPKTPMASPKPSYEQLSQVQEDPKIIQKQVTQLETQTKSKQDVQNHERPSPTGSHLELSLIQETPRLVKPPTASTKSPSTSPKSPPIGYLHSPLRIQGRPKTPRSSSKPSSVHHARHPSTQSKRTAHSTASAKSNKSSTKISKSQPRSRSQSQSRSRHSSSSRQQKDNTEGGPLDWSYQLKEATASKESLRLKRMQEEERDVYMRKLGMRNVRVAKGGFWRRAFGGR